MQTASFLPKTIRQLLISALVICPAAMLAGCNTATEGPASALVIKSNEGATPLVVKVARSAQKCWFATRDPAFTAYRMANETNSYSGRPRILLVPRKNPAGLPLLVVQAEKKGAATSGKYSELSAYGPLLSSPDGKRIHDDVSRWARGDASCKG